MKRCNCGQMMAPEGILDYPKTYCCPQCGGTLRIAKNGVQRWFDAKGIPTTYDPPTNNKKLVKGEEK